MKLLMGPPPTRTQRRRVYGTKTRERLDAATPLAIARATWWAMQPAGTPYSDFEKQQTERKVK